MTKTNYACVRIIIHFDNNAHNKPKKIKKEKQKLAAIIGNNGKIDTDVPWQNFSTVFKFFDKALYPISLCNRLCMRLANNLKN